ncbi:MAG TPA: hypothetical protein VHR86_02415 [Armatimonadota bacterium]|nr:hypothetical protein [Armatimonadota bacterium]
MSLSRVGMLLGLGVLLCCVLLVPSRTPAAQAPNETKGQDQLPGAIGQFVTVYSLQNGFNFAILSARYALEPFLGNVLIIAGTDEKLVVLDFAIKNNKKDDNWLNKEDLFTLVDEKGGLYTNKAVGLSSKPNADPSLNLHPGQGLGQLEQHDALEAAFVVPARVRIVKIMVNQGRAGHPEEKVLRYYVAGATKAEAGQAGDPKNIITALPDAAKDPADKSGAVALDEGKGTLGVYMPSGAFAIRLDSLTYSTDTLLEGNAPEDGKQYAIAAVTVKSLTDEAKTMFDVKGGDTPLYEITDTEGDRKEPAGFRRMKKDEPAEHEFKKGDEYSFRILFILDKDVTAKKLVLATGNAHKWAYDLTPAK